MRNNQRCHSLQSHPISLSKLLLHFTCQMWWGKTLKERIQVFIELQLEECPTSSLNSPITQTFGATKSVQFDLSLKNLYIEITSWSSSILGVVHEELSAVMVALKVDFAITNDLHIYIKLYDRETVALGGGIWELPRDDKHGKSHRESQGRSTIE